MKMTDRYKCSLFAMLIAMVSAGCSSHTYLTDSTMTTDVQHSGIIGQEVRTTQQMPLLENTYTRLLFPATPDFQFPKGDNWDMHVGVLDAGTKLQVNQVVKVNEPFAFLPLLPGYYLWNCALARVEDGPYAGKEIAVTGADMEYEEGTVVLGSPLLRPVNQASMISACDNMRSWAFFLPVPEKYDFYDSRSNLFATVTLVLPGSYSPDKFDGMWFGSLAKSYVRPKVEYTLTSDKLNVHDLHRLTGRLEFQSRAWAGVMDLNPDEPNDRILLLMPRTEVDGPGIGQWFHATDAGDIESGTFFGPVH